ncbi:hypothetical protein ACU639_17815 [Streptomyces cynarae]|uniref:hypothetical protein n=1 Tax=Streptomyces cynarae TaxID=2981134 RepID=UPI00406CAE64
MRAIQMTAGEVAYLLASCQFLVDELTKVTEAVDSITHLDTYQNAMLEKAATDQSAAIKVQLDHAARLAEHWQTLIDTALG